MVAEQTLVARDQVIPSGESWAGSPSCRVAADPGLAAMGDLPGCSSTACARRRGCVAGVLFLEFLPLIQFLPGLAILYLAQSSQWARALFLTPIAGLLFVLTTCLIVALGKALAMPAGRAGVFPAGSWFGLKKWMADKLMHVSLSSTNSLYATLYTAPWLRLLGARIGPRAEVSTVSNIDPNLLTIGRESFIADLAVLGAARYHRGYVSLGATEVGTRAFVGNAALVPGSSILPDGSLIGVQSVPPSGPMDAGSCWLGSPAIFLPRRQESQAFDETVTYRPSRRLIACRLAVEALRVIGPATLMYAAIATGSRAFLTLSALPSAALIAVLPLLYAALAMAVTGVVVALKWAVVGRYRPRVEPMWSSFVWRTELITALFENVAVPYVLRWLSGTPLMGPALRLFGSSIGRRVYLETTFLTEFDLVRVGDDAMIGGVTSLQTHLFEDRVMKMSTVEIGAGCSIGPRSVVLFDAKMAEGSRLDGLSLAMKGEALPRETHWQGIPSRLVR
jgi:non-ribosomal peptide synthetase-like protein